MTLPLQPDTQAALTFFGTLFPAGGTVHFRAVPEPRDNRPPTNHHYQLDRSFPAVLADFLSYCQAESRAAFFLPGTIPPGKTKAEDVLSLPAVLADLDKGDTAANLAAAEALLGPATIVVESGGTTDTGAAKLHVYWALEEPAMGAEIATACAAREALALKFGGDPAFKQSAQVIRIPGSIHFKGAPKLVRLRSVTANRFQLPTIVSQLGVVRKPPQTSDNIFDFNNATPAQNDGLDRALTAPIHSEGKDGITRFEGASKALGHFIRMVRDGRMTVEEAWEAAKNWNHATLVPPWDEDRLRTDFERLREIDAKQHGPIATAPVQAAPAEGWSIAAWRADRFQGAPPARVWTVDGVLPAATAGVFAAVGDAGKSMMALKLALDVATLAPMSAGLAFPPRFFGGDVMARGAAVLLTSEDDQDEVHRRLTALDPTNARASKPLYVVPMISAGGARAILADGPNGPAPTAFWSELRGQLAAIPDLRLVVLDPLSAFIAGDTNDNTLGSALMFMLAELATETGATVMLVHHFAKARMPGNLNEAREAIRGAGSLVDNARWALAMWEADEDTAHEALKALGQAARAKASGIVYRGGLAKGNAPGEKTIRTLVRNKDTGLLEDVTNQLRAATPKHDEIDDVVFKALMAEKMNNPAFSFPISRKSLEGHGVLEIVRNAADLSERQIEGAIKRLITNRQLQKTADRGTPRFEPVR